MENPGNPSTQYNPYHTPSWSPAEKKIARRVFDMALEKDLAQILKKAKQMALGLQKASDLWQLEDYIARSRKMIDARYDYRYSQLPIVFGQLAQHGLITLEDLKGLADNKLGYVRFALEARNDARRG